MSRCRPGKGWKVTSVKVRLSGRWLRESRWFVQLVRSRQRPGQSPGAWSRETDWDTMAVVLGAPGAEAQEAERRSHGPGSGLDPGFQRGQGLARLSCDPSVGAKGHVSGVREHGCPLPLLESADKAPAHFSVCEIRGENHREALGPWVLMGADSLECI